MTEPSLSLEAKAHYAAQILAERQYRDCHCWRVRIVKDRVYGKSLLAKLNETGKQTATDEAITEVVAITIYGSEIAVTFTPEEAYLIARSLVEP